MIFYIIEFSIFKAITRFFFLYKNIVFPEPEISCHGKFLNALPVSLKNLYGCESNVNI